jgi:ribosome-associated protein
MARNNDRVSKSQRKRDSKSLQQLGARLVELDPALLATLPIEETLGEAIALARRLDKQRGARKRQIQYIGKLLRRHDPTPLQEALIEIDLDHQRRVRSERLIGTWRERLLSEGDSAVAALVAEAPHLDRSQLLRLVTTARQERDSGAARSPAARALFRYLREHTLPDPADSGRGAPDRDGVDLESRLPDADRD